MPRAYFAAQDPDGESWQNEFPSTHTMCVPDHMCQAVTGCEVAGAVGNQGVHALSPRVLPHPRPTSRCPDTLLPRKCPSCRHHNCVGGGVAPSSLSGPRHSATPSCGATASTMRSSSSQTAWMGRRQTAKARRLQQPLRPTSQAARQIGPSALALMRSLSTLRPWCFSCDASLGWQSVTSRRRRRWCGGALRR